MGCTCSKEKMGKAEKMLLAERITTVVTRAAVDYEDPDAIILLARLDRLALAFS